MLTRVLGRAERVNGSFKTIRMLKELRNIYITREDNITREEFNCLISTLQNMPNKHVTVRVHAGFNLTYDSFMEETAGYLVFYGSFENDVDLHVWVDNNPQGRKKVEPSYIMARLNPILYEIY